MEELEQITLESKKDMEYSIEYLKNSFLRIRTGKAHPAMIESINVEYHGTSITLNKLANISVRDAMTLNIQPWEGGGHVLSSIDRAILNANIGLTPINNGESILIHLLPLTHEHRKKLVKKSKNETELTKVSLRTIRKQANKRLKKIKLLPEDLLKKTEKHIQQMTNFYIKKTEELLAVKEKQILTI